MSTVATTLEQVGENEVRATWAGTGPFYVYRDGVLIGTTDQLSMDFMLDPGETLALEVFDDPDDVATSNDPRFEYSWTGLGVALVDFYRVETRYAGGEWATVADIDETGAATYTWHPPGALDDCKFYYVRVTPYSPAGNAGTAFEMIRPMVRHPDPPENTAYTYSGAVAKTVTVNIGDYRADYDYNLYHAEDAEIDWETATPEWNPTAFPYVTTAIGVSHVHHFCLRTVNRFTLESQNVAEWTVETDGTGAEAATRPSAPTDVSLSAAAGGAVRVQAVYDHNADGDDLADTWLIYLKGGGGDPDPDVDTPIEETISPNISPALLDYTTVVTWGDGVGVVGLVRTRRTIPGEPPAPDTYVDSDNVDMHSTTAETTGPAGLSVSTAGDDRNWIRFWEYDSDNYVEWREVPAALRIVCGGNLVAILEGPEPVSNTQTAEGTKLHLKGGERALPYDTSVVQTPSISEDGSIEYADSKICFAVGATTKYRVMEIDSEGTLRVAERRSLGPPEEATAFLLPVRFAASGSLDFALNLMYQNMRIEAVEIGGAVNGRLCIKDVRTHETLSFSS